jgi:hypothetical protein
MLIIITLLYASWLRKNKRPGSNIIRNTKSRQLLRIILSFYINIVDRREAIREVII